MGCNMGSRSPKMACGYPAEQLSGTAPTDAYVPNSPSATDSSPVDLQVVIGTSEMLAKDDTLVRRIANFSEKWEGEIRQRMAMGDVGDKRANRLMHIALLNGVAVGWCSSSTAGYGGDGHWGALAVDPSSQGRGVASALVKAAEKRLINAGCRSVQIEYRFTIGNPDKERLYNWYEGKLGFDGGPRRSGFRCCHKALSAKTFEAQHARRSMLGQGQPYADPEASVEQEQNESKRARAASASSTSSSAPSPSSDTDLDPPRQSP